MKNKLLLFGYVFAASFGAFVVGLNLGGISGALEFITAEFGLSAMAMGLVTSAIMIGCLIGALLGGRYSDKYGRRNMMIISAVMLILSAVGCAMASNAAWLIAARFLGGCGMGVLSAVIPIYISEISPAKWRGAFVLPVIHRYRHSCCLLRRFRDDFVGKQLALDARIAVVVRSGQSADAVVSARKSALADQTGGI